MEKIDVSSYDLSLLDKLVGLSDGTYSRSSVLHSAIISYFDSVIGALNYEI